jgi:hypothetical protein
MFWQSLTDIQKYAVLGVLVMAIMVFGLPLLLVFLNKHGIKMDLTKSTNLNREQQRKEKTLAKKKRRRQ